jgi:signal transduction histidine kinase/HAMP domain-containing protein
VDAPRAARPPEPGRSTGRDPGWDALDPGASAWAIGAPGATPPETQLRPVRRVVVERQVDEPRSRLSFRARLTASLIAAAVLPLAGFGIVALLTAPPAAATAIPIGPILGFAIAIAFVFGVLLAYMLATDFAAPLRAIAQAVERASAGDLTTPIQASGDDEIARLAESHNRLAADLERRNRELGRVLVAMEDASPRDGIDQLTRRAARDAREAFGLIDASVLLVDPREIPTEVPVPGDPRPIRAELRTGGEALGLIVGHLPATRRWERADQDLLELFAFEIAVAIRNAQLFARVEAQNQRLRELDAAKDDFLRGVSHNLQTPLASIRAYADQLAGDHPDRRLGIITEQSDRLSRMVRQLLTVTRLESGALRPKSDVLALGQRVRRTWEALASDAPFQLADHSVGWLAVADADQLDQVLWALLDNALKYGRGAPVDVTIAPDIQASVLKLTISDGGPGVTASDRERLFGRFERGGAGSTEGSGLGLYVSRELCRAMGGDLVLDDPIAGRGASFTISLPAEPGEET